MAGRIRTTKKLAQRINLNYFKTLGGIPRWRRILSGVFVIAGLAWLGWHALAGSPKPYNAGPLAHAHALLGQKCGVCHVSEASYRQSATDQACLACHDGPIHHVEQTFTPSCSSCHVEHQGAFRLASTSTAACTQCHADLKTTHGTSKLASNIRGFDGSHPEFAALRQGLTDPGTIKLNHHVHLKDGLLGPNDPVQLQCADCHRRDSLDRSYMQPVNYEKHCAACHPLQFDRRFSESAPHKEPKVVYDFVFAKLTEYIAAHPAEIPLVDEPDKRLPTRPPQPPARNAAEWVQQRMADAQLLLWRKSCKECHSVSYPNGRGSLPVVAKAAITTRWLPHATFDHEAHQMLQCVSCHVKANESRETSDVLIPGIQTCQQCHRTGQDAAEARCFECHTYHDWSKGKAVAGKYRVKQLAE
jgi:predicted CXXCH cytochrome family protein